MNIWQIKNVLKKIIIGIVAVLFIISTILCFSGCDVKVTQPYDIDTENTGYSIVARENTEGLLHATIYYAVDQMTGIMYTTRAGTGSCLTPILSNDKNKPYITYDEWKEWAKNRENITLWDSAP